MPAKGHESNQAEMFSFRKYVARRLVRNRGAMGGLAILLLFILSSVFAPQLSPYDPYDVSPNRLAPPSRENPLGTDPLGRDVLSRLLYGGRISLQVGLIAVGIAAVMGTTLGLVAGYLGGWLDNVIMRVMDILLAFPGILLALVIIAVLGSGLFNVMIALGIASIPQYTRLVRGSVLSVKENEYVMAAVAQGAGVPRILIRHLIPNISAPIIVVSTLGVAGAILACAGLSFIGLGPPPPTAEWGAMLAGSRVYIRRAWWLVAFPGLAITLSVVAINMFGDGLRDALDPELK
ncbi:MAG: ABC transporter permease [Bacillota bacterium]